jgi:tellurite resistance protein TehA-like permease
LGLLSEWSPNSLLVSIAPLTAATVGGLLCEFTDISARMQVPVVIYAWWLLGMGLFLAFLFTTLHVVKMATKTNLPVMLAPSAIITIGPFGQAATALLTLGTVVQRGAFAEYARGQFLTSATQEAVFAVSVMGAMLLQGIRSVFGLSRSCLSRLISLGSLFWGFIVTAELFQALSVNKRQTGQYISYSLSWWSLVFPIGLFSSSPSPPVLRLPAQR